MSIVKVYVDLWRLDGMLGCSVMIDGWTEKDGKRERDRGRMQKRTVKASGRFTRDYFLLSLHS